VEGADQVESWKSIGLDWLPGALTASSDAGVNSLAWPIYWIAIVLVSLTGAYLFTRFFRGLPGSDPEPGVEASQPTLG
jgi:hypothetical protein